MSSTEPSTSKRFQFSLKQLLFATGFICLVLAIWFSFLRSKLVIWLPSEAEKKAEIHFGFEDEYKDYDTRVIAMAKGSFAKGHGIHTECQLIEDSKILRIGQAGKHRSNNQIGGGPWRTYTFSIAILQKDKDSPKGPLALQISGGSAGGGSGFGDYPLPNFPIQKSQTYPGTIYSGRTYLLHVEGDRPFQANPTMTVEEFSQKNPVGMFRIVTIAVF